MYNVLIFKRCDGFYLFFSLSTSNEDITSFRVNFNGINEKFLVIIIFGVGSNGTDDRTAVVALSQQKVGASIDDPEPNDAENPASGVTRHQVEHHGQARVRALGCAMD